MQRRKLILVNSRFHNVPNSSFSIASILLMLYFWPASSFSFLLLPVLEQHRIACPAVKATETPRAVVVAVAVVAVVGGVGGAEQVVVAGEEEVAEEVV